MNKIDLNGRVAIVTGGAQGFGRAIVQRFVASGAKVAIWDFDAALAEKTAKEIGDNARVFKVDVTDTAAVEQARDATLAAFGKIDILVNNAGIAGVNKPVWETDLEEWRKVLRINLDGRARDAQAEVRTHRQHRLDRRQGRQSERLALFGVQGRPDRADEVARQGIGGT
jgi:3-oxoacyl-[acyl-carrier protein] reductase